MAQEAGRRQRKAGVVALVVVGVVALSCNQTAWVSPPGQASRRDAVNGGLLGFLSAAIGAAPANAYELPPLPYAIDALEPSIDKETMEIHHDRHHNTYVTNINKAFEGKDQPPLLEIQKEAIKTSPAWRNSGGGAYNHNFFWLEMAPKGAGGEPSAELSEAIKDAFGSFEEFQEKFEAAGAPGARFGSGWVWLIVTKDGKLAITSTPNQDNPLMEGVDATEGIPILGIDVWEHAYYLKYQWQRPAYIKAWWDVVNWNQVNAWYKDALDGKAPTADSAYVGAAMVGARRPAGQLRGTDAPRSFKFGFDVKAQFDF